MKTLTSKAKVIITAVAAAVVAAGIVAGVLLTRQDSYRVLKVFELMGTASVTRESAGDLDAYVGMNLESGDVVSVDDNSNMRISLDSDKYVLLDAGTVLELVAAGNRAECLMKAGGRSLKLKVQLPEKRLKQLGLGGN